jgi:uncharacterized protein YrrD
MDFRFGDEVWRPDGGKLGELRRAVLDPETDEVVSLVVLESRVDGAEVVVPIGLVDSAEEGSVVLSTTQDQFEGLDRFAGLRNLAPAPDAANIKRHEITDPVDVPDIPPFGASAGVESIAYTPILEEDVYVPPYDRVIDGQTVVYATDGEVGHIHSLRIHDDTRRLESIVVVHGVVFAHFVVVPIEVVTDIQPESIVLSVPKDELKSLDDD